MASGDYGSGEHHQLIVDQSGPLPPPADVVVAAQLVLDGKGDLPRPCLDCAPNLVLKDQLCPVHAEWEWGLLVAHDDTCPALLGIVSSADAG